MEGKENWGIFYKGKVIPVDDTAIRWIKQDPTKVWGWFETDLMVAWKNLFPFNGEKQTIGLSAIEGRGVDHNSEPMVEIFDRSASNSGTSDDKLRAISNRIRHVELGKISIGSKGDVDGASDFRTEDIGHQSGGMLVDGQPS